MAAADAFMTETRKTFTWPYSKPLSAKPTQPPITTKSKNFFVKGPVDAYCHCDGHLYDPLLNRYLKLSEKEKLLHDELRALNTEMANLNTEILEQECDTYDDKMESLYQIDYVKKGMTPAKYVKLMPAIDSPAGFPPKNLTGSTNKAYRDPTRFRYSPFPRPTIDSCPPVTFASVTSGVQSWFSKETGRSEYQEVTSKVGLSLMKSRQQYTEPLPSSRRRIGELNL
ncbi:hypothetical protein FQR65_LT12595 [Abscondita terminalis]|nr:hypothetical protein FQR65_LT12595 [Abscondita terminalis]